MGGCHGLHRRCRTACGALHPLRRSRCAHTGGLADHCDADCRQLYPAASACARAPYRNDVGAVDAAHVHEFGSSAIFVTRVMTFIRWPRDFATGKTPSIAELGGKGYALALLSSQLPVPDWFAVTPAAFDGILGGLGVESPGSPRALQPIVSTDLSAAAAQLCPAGQAVAVRSSAADEDSAALSFAGQLESYLFVHPS